MSNISDTIAYGEIGNALKSTAADHVVAVADDLYDTAIGRYQSEINRMALSGGENSQNHYFMSTDEYAILVKEGQIEINGEVIYYNDSAYYALYEPEEEEEE